MRGFEILLQRLLRGPDINALEDSRRILILILLSGLGVTLVGGFGIASLMQGRMTLAFILLFASALAILNLIWLFHTRSYRRAAVLLAFIIASLSLFLVITGGVDGTGLIWITPLLAVVIFTAGFRAGVYIFSLFYCAATVALLWSGSPIPVYDYAISVKYRFLLALLSMGVTCLLVEYVYSQSRHKVAELHKAVKLNAQTDALTQLPNRRYVTEKLLIDGRFVPDCSNGCVVLADIDHFKLVNDRYGHAVGDGVLQSVAGYLSSEIRNADVVVRWGGEEFLLVLPGISLERARQRVESLRAGLANLIIESQGQRLNVTLSFGLAGIRAGESADKILKRADDNLYKAKSAGRNCVVADQ